MLTPKENLLAVLRHEEPERIPVTPLIDAYLLPNDLPQNMANKVLRWISFISEEQSFDIKASSDIVKEFNKVRVDIARYLGGDVMDRHVPIINTLYGQTKITKKGETA